MPGCVDGWDMLLKRFGTMSFAQVLEPAIKYAEKGFPVNNWVDPDDPLLERKEFRETYLPEVFNRDLMEGWKKKGSRSVRQVAQERAKQILKDHEPEPLDKDIEQAVVEIIKDIENRE